ncbi:ABC transporter permease [Celeribacter neptunius]|uniref:Transport permease protein n=1 Tax=Celeribacter neptunius TaxID=588602 RepID=A0A1I3SWZ2_9RHOB|nr:ABC transporter permease [Celeribacter neptunius]SFJ62389.1 capsular polysaccharide transport system permease protein [Celeribacter neptunius]
MKRIERQATLVYAGRTISALMLREMSTNYGRAPGGYIWAILEPIAGIALITLLFSFVLRQPPIGDNFPLFYASGILPFTMYKDLSAKIGRSVSFSEKLLTYPMVTHADAILARLFLNAFTQMVIFVILLGAILIFGKIPLRQLDPGIMALSLSGVFVFSFGVGTFNAFLFEKFPVWDQIWGILNRPMFLISSVFFLFESTPAAFQKLLWFNPLVHIIGLMRRGLYPSYDANFISLTYIFGPPLALAALGLILLRAVYSAN